MSEPVKAAVIVCVGLLAAVVLWIGYQEFKAHQARAAVEEAQAAALKSIADEFAATQVRRLVDDCAQVYKPGCKRPKP